MDFPIVFQEQVVDSETLRPSSSYQLQQRQQQLRRHSPEERLLTSRSSDAFLSSEPFAAAPSTYQQVRSQPASLFRHPDPRSSYSFYPSTSQACHEQPLDPVDRQHRAPQEQLLTHASSAEYPSSLADLITVPSRHSSRLEDQPVM